MPKAVTEVMWIAVWNERTAMVPVVKTWSLVPRLAVIEPRAKSQLAPRALCTEPW